MVCLFIRLVKYDLVTIFFAPLLSKFTKYAHVPILMCTRALQEMTDSGAAVFSYDGSGIIEKSVRGSSPLGDVIYAIQESYLPDIVSNGHPIS